MKKFDDELKNILNDGFSGQFIRSMVCSVQKNSVDIDCLCDDIADKSDEIKKCTRMASRYLELYSVFGDALIDNKKLEETFEVNHLVKDFAENCSKCTGLKFYVQKNQIDLTYIKVNNKILTCVVLMQIRDAFLKGAKSIRFSYTANEKFFNLSLNFKRLKKDLSTSLEEDAMQDFFVEISDWLAEKINSEISDSEDGVVIKIPIYKCMEFNAEREKIGSSDYLALYSAMLSDFSR